MNPQVTRLASGIGSAASPKTAHDTAQIRPTSARAWLRRSRRTSRSTSSCVATIKAVLTVSDNATMCADMWASTVEQAGRPESNAGAAGEVDEEGGDQYQPQRAARQHVAVADSWLIRAPGSGQARQEGESDSEQQARCGVGQEESLEGSRMVDVGDDRAEGRAEADSGVLGCEVDRERPLLGFRFRIKAGNHGPYCREHRRPGRAVYHQ